MGGNGVQRPFWAAVLHKAKLAGLSTGRSGRFEAGVPPSLASKRRLSGNGRLREKCRQSPFCMSCCIPRVRASVFVLRRRCFATQLIRPMSQSLW